MHAGAESHACISWRLLLPAIKTFIAEPQHELRTPLAILQIHVR